MFNYKSRVFNRFDFLLLLIIILASYYWHMGYIGMHQASYFNSNITNSNTNNNLTPSLAYDMLRTNMRLIYGLFWSFLFTFIFGFLAAKFKTAERIILPFINFMESVPLVGFMTFSIVFFTNLYPNNTMGLESAAIFGVFTGQVWNMTLSLYQSLKVVPNELIELADNFKLNSWKRFWRIELPYAIPGLLWNTMVSQSAAWFALVGTESISIESISMGNKTIQMPGVGSYIQDALDHKNIHNVLYAILALIISVILFDQFLFRPLVKWADKFKFERTKSASNNIKHSSWFYDLLVNSNFILRVISCISQVFNNIIFIIVKSIDIIKQEFLLDSFLLNFKYFIKKSEKLFSYLIYSLVMAFLLYAFVKLYYYLPIYNNANGANGVNGINGIKHMAYLMLLTTLRVAAAMILSLIIFLPIGIWIGLSPKRTKFCQPVIQVMAALPPDILYPMLAIFLVAFHQSLSWWSIIMIMLGTQWYILFNVIAGVLALPDDLKSMAASFQAKGWFCWRKFIIPGIFPYIVTGIISAAGGAWNADITAEVISWGKNTLSTDGLGAYIASATNDGHDPQSALGCLLMCGLVACCIIFVWRPLYRLAETRFCVK